MSESKPLPLFEAYPNLAAELPHIDLTELPTPVDAHPRVAKKLGVKCLYIKRDDIAAQEYGGNKVRKLEFLLAKALRDERKRVVTFGAAGSNHALATAIYAKSVGLSSDSVLIPQVRARYVRDNLLASAATGATLHYVEDPTKSGDTIKQIAARYEVEEGVAPQIIYPGGSSPLGTVGFVNAAFELRRQAERGEFNFPDAIYVPLGSRGTAVGLALGFAALEVQTQVVAVRVVGDDISDEEKCRDLFVKTNDLLRAADPTFPACRFEGSPLTVSHDFFGEEYARYTHESIAAVKFAARELDIKLEGTYTGKAFAALLHDSKQGNLENKNVMFWNTYNSRPLEKLTAGDYRDLPKEFHTYFEDELQPLEER